MPEPQVEVEASVKQAQRIRLDKGRQQTAMKRIETQRELAAHHEGLAHAARGQIDVLIRTWQICPLDYTLMPEDTIGACCRRPDACDYVSDNGHQG